MSQLHSTSGECVARYPQVAPVFWSFRIMVGLWFPAATGDADCALSRRCVAKSTSIAGAENGALEFAVAVDCGLKPGGL